MGSGEVADELALAVAMSGELTRDGLRLTEAVGEVAMGRGDEQTGARHTLLEVLPFVLGEVRLSCHVPSSAGSG